MKMTRNPYEPPRTSDQVATVPARALPFPFDLVLRVVIGAALCILGASSMVWLHGQWDRLADLAIIQPSSNPWLFVVPFVAMILTGVAMLVRSRFAFVPFGIYCVFCGALAWRLFGWHQPRVFLLAFGLQLALLGFLVRLLSRNLLR
jgi:hypothetical protein